MIFRTVNGARSWCLKVAIDTLADIATYSDNDPEKMTVALDSYSYEYRNILSQLFNSVPSDILGEFSTYTFISTDKDGKIKFSDAFLEYKCFKAYVTAFLMLEPVNTVWEWRLGEKHYVFKGKPYGSINGEE